MGRLSGNYRRLGSLRIRIMLGREAIVIGKKRCSRLWSASRSSGALQMTPTPRYRFAPAVACSYRSQPRTELRFRLRRWANGQQLKCLTVVDEYTRECLAIDVSGSIRSARVIEVLSKLISVHGTPRYMQSDSGPEFVSAVLLKWVVSEKIESA
jgi:putative transposase